MAKMVGEKSAFMRRHYVKKLAQSHEEILSLILLQSWSLNPLETPTSHGAVMTKNMWSGHEARFQPAWMVLPFTQPKFLPSLRWCFLLSLLFLSHNNLVTIQFLSIHQFYCLTCCFRCDIGHKSKPFAPAL